jgi:hypothetical protein
MILVCGGIADRVTELVCARLDACGYPYRLLDFGVYPAGYTVDWTWSGGYPCGTIAGPGWVVDLSELSGVYVRYLGPEGRAALPDVAPHLAPALFAEYDAAFGLLLEDLPCLVVNKLGPGLSNHSKPYQSLLLRQCGIRTPDTLVTTDPAEARAFYERHRGEVIYKSLSGVRSIVRRLGPAQLERLPLLAHGPAQFQAFVPGDNVRVHTVGDHLFATRVRSDAVDYRYAKREGAAMEMQAFELPPETAAACLRASRALGLPLAGIDFKLTPEGEYVCFEVNPSPGFLFYEQYTGQPISAALADLLLAGRPAAFTRSQEYVHG